MAILVTGAIGISCDNDITDESSPYGSGYTTDDGFTPPKPPPPPPPPPTNP